MLCSSFELDIQQRSWSEAEDTIGTTGSDVVGKPKVPIAEVLAGGMSYSLQEHQRAPWKLSWGQKGKQWGGWEGAMRWATCSQGFRYWPNSAAIEVWVVGTTSMRADVGRSWEFLQSPGVCVTRWDHPIVPDPRCPRDGEKKHMWVGSFSYRNLLCVFPSLRARACIYPNKLECVPMLFAFAPRSVPSRR